MCARLCLLNTAPGEREWLEFSPLAPRQTPRTRRRTQGICSSSLLPWLNISETQAVKKKQTQNKNKKPGGENQNILLGGKKNSRGKKCRRVMRTSESNKCIRSSLETGA